MGKIVKYCSSCDEGFAERFAFCPTCGTTLQAFEMNPVEAGGVAPEEVTAEREAYAEPETHLNDAPDAALPVVGAASAALIADDVVEAGHIDEDEVEISEPDEEDEVPVTIAVPAAAASVFATQAVHADEPRAMKVTPEALDDGYYITVIEEKGVTQRNMLLLGSTILCLSVAIGATIYSLFDKDLGVGAIDEGKLFSAVIVDEPMTVEEEQIKKDKDKGGGGGGGGRDEEDPVSQGDLADQSRNPTRPPDAKVPRMDFELVTPPPQTEGDRKFAKNFDRWGDPNSKFAGLSNGPGTGGGQGTGVGTGQGSGRGTGTGSGSGSGSGGGTGDGDGDGTGSGGSDRGGPPPVRPPITKDLRIISKTRPGYTDAARQNQITGTVTLRVTFLASGQIGGITTISGLPHGLTEQAIAAARRITFEPKMVNGVPQSISRPVTFTFTIY